MIDDEEHAVVYAKHTRKPEQHNSLQDEHFGD